MSSVEWPDWATPEPERAGPGPAGTPGHRTGPSLFGLGPVGIAGIVTAVLMLFGIGSVVLPPMFAGGSTDTLPPAYGAPAANDAPLVGSDSSADPTASDVPSSAEPSTESPSATPTPTRTAPTRTAPATPNPAVSTNPDFEEKVVDLVNRERARSRKRCAEVRVDGKLQAAARAHSVDMATQNYFSSTGRDGSSPLDRMRRAGYPQGLSENLAKGQSTPEQVMKAWMNSAGHRANILNCDAKALGVGLAYRGRTPVWTQNFGRI